MRGRHSDAEIVSVAPSYSPNLQSRKRSLDELTFINVVK